MANPEHLKILTKGVAIWNRWRDKNPNVQPDLINVNLNEANLRNINFRGADLSGADLSSANLKWASLSNAKLLLGANLSGAKLSGADLTGAKLRIANLSGAGLQGARLKGADLVGTTLNRANLSEAELTGSILSKADLTRANLRWGNLSETDLSRSNLSGADLTKTKIIGANFKWADLSASDLSEANLSEANFSSCELNDSIFYRTIISDTIFGHTNLKKIRNLNSCIHHGPSVIDFETIKRSWPLPLKFLRGIGLSDDFIENLPALVKVAIQFYSCFISYSHKDNEFASRLHADLQDRGIRCWFAQENMKTGDKIRSTIDDAIRIHDKLLLILSENSINSDWVEKEVEAAFEKEKKEKRTVLFPIRLDESVMNTKLAWAADIRRTRHIGDFREWKDHDKYTKAFERLLRDLRAGK